MNELKKEFDEIVELYEGKAEEYGERASYFMEPATNEEILEWEKNTGIQMPEDYKEWLKCTKSCQMCSTIATLIFPQIKQPEFLPHDYVLIGYVVGDGEVLCFSKSNGKYITFFEGNVNEEFDKFISFLKSIKRDIKGELPEIDLTEERLARMMSNLNEMLGNADK
jgi:hypothetical protein